MSVSWNSTQQGTSGLWFKSGMDDRGRKHLLVSENRSGIDGGTHDHYWDNGDGTYGVQLKDKSGTATINDSKGHIYPKDTTFPAMTNKYLKQLFNSY